MEETQDNFSFDDFLSDGTKAELGIPAETSAVPEPAPAEVTPTVETTEAPVETKAEEVVESTPTTPPLATDAPVKAVDEPDWKYNYRMEIWEKQQQLKQAQSDSERAEIKNDINSVRKEIAQRAKQETPEFDPTDIDRVVEEKLALREQVQTIDKAESDFIKRHPEMRNDVIYNQFVEYVADTYNIKNKSYNALTAILESAYETIYPKASTQIAKAKEVEQKINAVDFSGSSASPEVPQEQQEQKALVDGIKATSGNDFSWIL